MFFNLKERLTKTKQSQVNYEVERINARFANSLPKQIKLNTTIPQYKMLLNIVEPSVVADKHYSYIKNNITKITNVYQQMYNNFKKPSGFGDFIRGSYFVIQFCERYNIDCNIVINHPIKKYLKIYSNEIEKECEPNLLITSFDKPNFFPENPEKSKNKDIIDDFCSYLKEPGPTLENRIANVYAISFPFETVTYKQRAVMRKYLEPTYSFKFFILNSLKSVRLVLKKYTVIHIRSGDNFLIYKEDINLEYLKKIVLEIYKTYNTNYEYLLLSDSIKLKEKIIKIFPNIRVTLNEITHSGEGVELTEETLRNTMLDFYLMAYSERIYSYSCYDHGTGFSRWCAETFNIPYTCSIVK